MGPCSMGNIRLSRVAKAVIAARVAAIRALLAETRR